MRLIDAERFGIISCKIPKKYQTEKERDAYIDGMTYVLEQIDRAETVGKAWDDEEVDY